MKKVVVIGGGTGTATVLSSLVGDEELSLTGIVSIADSGGSTGRLRDEFGFIPVGDVRQCLGALAVGENSNLVRELLLYRFPQQSSLVGHNLGNLILTALTDLYLRARQKEVSKSVGKSSPEDRPAVLAKAKELSEQVKAAETTANEADAEATQIGRASCRERV